MGKKIDALGAILNKRATPIDSSLQEGQQPQSVIKPKADEKPFSERVEGAKPIVPPANNNPQVANTNVGQSAPVVQQPPQQPVAAPQQPVAQPPQPQQVKKSDYTFYSMTDTPDNAVNANDIERLTGYQLEKTPQQQEAEKKRQLDYEAMQRLMDEEIKRREPENEKEREQREKREKRRLLWASIGDGISALANLHFTTQDAPHAYNDKDGMLQRHQALLDRMQKERKENRDKYLEYVLKRAQLSDNEARRQDEDQARKQNAIMTAQRMKMQEEEHAWQRDLAGAKIAGAEADAQNKQAIADAQAAVQQAKIDLYKAKTKTEKTTAEKNLAIAMRNLRDAQSNSIKAAKMRDESRGEFIAYDKNGNKHYFSSAAAQERFSREQGTWVDDYVNTTSTTKGAMADKNTTTTKRVVKGGHSRNPKKWASGLHL